MYSQQQYGPPPSFQQPSYGSYPSYYQPPPPPPVPVYQPDPVTFRRDYSNQLAELKVNSRPIIQNLSMIAQEFARFSEIVAQCLESHIRRVPQWMKLPAFYLLDAISKNVYEPYARNFAAFVVPLFLETYSQVDQSTRSKMEEMLLTWRTGSPAGKELFGVPAQMAIERGVWGDGASSSPVGRAPSAGLPAINNRPAQTNSFYSGSGQITKTQVLTELEFTLNQKERALQGNLYDTTLQTHISVLHQLRKLVEAGVSQEELQQILTQLRSLVRSVAAPTPTPAPPPPPPAVAPSVSWPPAQQPSYPPQQPTFPPAPAPTYPSFPTYDNVKTEPPPSVLPSASAAASGSSAQNSILSLLSTIKKVVGENGTPLGAGASSGEDVKLEPPPPDLERESSRSYRDAILMHDVKLSSTDIIRKRPDVVEFLYDRLAAQCKQCGIRFPDTVFGKKRMEDHLDMHFKQNRKANQNIGRGHSRSWFVGVEDWVHDVSVDVKGKGREAGARPMNAKATAAAEVAKRDADLRAQYVVVPRGEEANPVACPICKEQFKSEFLDDEEEWVWRNAVLKDERVYHATCHAEAATGLALRLRSELAANLRSHSNTPEAASMGSVAAARAGGVSTPPPSGLKISDALRSVSLSPSPESKLVGTKRKVDDTDHSVSDEAEGTPRLKKMALTAADSMPQ